MEHLIPDLVARGMDLVDARRARQHVEVESPRDPHARALAGGGRVTKGALTARVVHQRLALGGHQARATVDELSGRRLVARAEIIASPSTGEGERHPETAQGGSR